VNRGSLLQVKKTEIQALIMQHAIDEFEKNGYSNATIRNIADRSGVSIGNIYRYFTNKKDLLRAVIQPVYDRLSSLVFDLYRNETDSVNDISVIAYQVSHGIMQIYKQHGRELMILIDKNTGSPYENFVNTLINMVNERLKQELVFTNDQAQIVSFIASSGFVNGLFIILRQYKDIESAQETIRQTILLFFGDIHQRLRNKEVA
jgi:AcrR family transcriptional regulator